MIWVERARIFRKKSLPMQEEKQDMGREGKDFQKKPLPIQEEKQDMGREGKSFQEKTSTHARRKARYG